MAFRFRQGLYIPKHPEKYVGDVTRIQYRSSWELEVNRFFDNNPNVLHWASEEVVVPYVKPTDGKVHKYYVDYWIQYKTNEGDIKYELIEVKPSTQCRPSRSRKPKTRLNENITYAINCAKWEAAEKFAEQHGWTFRILDENSIFH